MFIATKAESGERILSGDGTVPEDSIDHLRWTVESSEVLLRDRWINLRSDVCVTSTGAVVSPYYIQENPDWVSVFALDEENRLLLAHEYHHGAQRTGRGLPGGALNSDDELPATGALRELVEETGYQPMQLFDLGWVWANWNSQTNRLHCFLATGCTSSGTVDLDDTENIEIERLPLDRFSPGQLAQGYHQLNAYMALEKLRNAGP